MARRCVYTCLIGDYELLNDQPIASRSALDFLCFTDDTRLTSDSWRIVPITLTYPLDLVRSQRVVKIIGDQVLADYDASMYIDNTVILKERPEVLLDEYLAHDDFAVPHHSFRDTVTNEFLEVLRLGFDDGSRVVEQLNHYAMTTPEVLSQQPFWTGIMFRRHGVPALQQAMQLWLHHVLRYSRRDQLSLNYALGAVGLRPRTIAIDNLTSAFHQWSTAPGRDRTAALRHPVEAMLPPSILAQQFLERAVQASHELRAAAQQRGEVEREIASVRQRLDAATRERDAASESAVRLHVRLDAALGEIEGLREALAARVMLLADAETRRDEAAARIAGLAAELAVAQTGAVAAGESIAALQAALDVARAEAQACHAALAATHRSTSWRLTAPIRWLAFLKPR